jgi:hypothetical protein
VIDTPVQTQGPLVEVIFLRDAAAVKRFHTKRTIREDTLARHSFGVMQIIQCVFPECRKELLLAAMHHDLPEYITGDIPAPAKRNSPQLAVILEEMEKGTTPLYQDFGLTPAEEFVLGWADRMELALWCIEEVTMGNRYCIAPIHNVMKWMGETMQSPAAGPYFAVPRHVREVMETLYASVAGHIKEL